MGRHARWGRYFCEQGLVLDIGHSPPCIWWGLSEVVGGGRP